MLRRLRRFARSTRAGRVAWKAFRSARNTAIGAYIRFWPGKTVPGVLTIVVPVYKVENYIKPAIRSLRDQKYSRIQVLLIDDGSPDRSIEIARKQVRKDPRLRIVHQRNQGPSAARNLGAKLARGEFLTFVDSDDTVTPRVYVHAIESLRASGSDFAVFGYQRIQGKKTIAAGEWIRELHAQPQRRANLDLRPDVQVNAVPWTKVYRTSFYRKADITFPVGKFYEDQPASTQAFARAEAFDILNDVGVNWRIREDSSSTTQQEHEADNLRAQLDAGLDSLEILREHGKLEARAVRAEQILARNLNFYTQGLLNCTEDYFEAYRNYARLLLEMVDTSRLGEFLPIRQRIIYVLASHVTLDEMRDILTSKALSFNELPVRMTPEGARIMQSPLLGDARFEGVLSEDLFALGASDTGLIAGVKRHWFSKGRLWIEGWAYLGGVEADLEDRRLRLWVAGDGGAEVDFDVELRHDDAIDEFTGHRFIDYRSGGFLASVPLAALPARRISTVRARADVHGLTAEGSLYRRGQPEGGRTSSAEHGGAWFYASAAGGRELTIERDQGVRQDRLQAFAAKTPGDLLAVRVNEQGVEVDLQVRAAHEGELRVVLEGSKVSVPGAIVSRTGAVTTVSFPLRASQWGVDDVPLPSGKYYVRIEDTQAKSRDLWPSERVAREAPLDELIASHRVRVRIRQDGARSYPVIELSAPKTLDERGWRNHRRLVEAYEGVAPSENAFFFRSLYGEVANCNAKGIHEEIDRQGLDITRYWSVADLSVQVPEGGIPVLEGTEEWHRALRASRYFVVNVHQHPWYVKHPEQVLIETFHGYPYKQMGHDYWTAHRFPAAQLAQFDRRAREWNYVVSPASYATPLLREAFTKPAGSDAVFLETGYPRNDVLLRPDELGERRIATRDLLGLGTEKAVLYAPTFRDYLTSQELSADLVNLLDLDELAERLGEDYVVLLRGHPFNARADKKRRAGAARVIDVTAYPDINDLIAASDAGILDYSSLRFDYALTDKPMVFFVPDDAQYHEQRPGLLPYGETTAGPLLTELDEVVAALSDLDALATANAERRAAVLASYADLDDGRAGERLLAALGVTG